MKTLIKNGTVVTAGDTFKADVLIEGEKIALIGNDLSAEGAEIIDAAGLFLLPGGIDGHTHLDMPFGGTTTADDFLQARERPLSAVQQPTWILHCSRKGKLFCRVWRCGRRKRKGMQ